MPPDTRKLISCPQCGKQYVWKPELAGKTVRCKCGHPMAVPAMTPSSAAGVSTPHSTKHSPVSDNNALYDLAAESAPESGSHQPPRQSAAPAAVSIPGLDDDLYRCPSCGQGMEPGAIICSQCGFNLKTGKKITAATTSAQTKSPSAAFAGLAPRAARQVAADGFDQWIKILVPLGLIVVLVLGVMGYKWLMPAAQAPAKPVNRDDAEVARLTAQDGATEIHEWYKQNPQRIAGEFNRRQALARADELQQMGAKKVLAFGWAMTRSLAVELPENPSQRKKLFEWENQFARDHHYKPAIDQGQKYLLLNLGP